MHCNLTWSAFLCCFFAAGAAADIGTVTLERTTDTTITVRYELNAQYVRTDTFRVAYAGPDGKNIINVTNDSRNVIENLEPSTVYVITVSTHAHRRNGPPNPVRRILGDVTVRTKGKNFAQCPPVVWWTPDGSTGSHDASYDTANCFVADLSMHGITFVHNNNYYLRPRSGVSCPASQCTCPAGTLDNGNCLIMEKPPFGFIADNSFYMQAGAGGKCFMGTYAGASRCLISKAAPATIAFELNRKFYTTRTPYCAAGTFDGANCWIGTAPGRRIGFVHNGAFYYE
jgi:hypothetical protein